MQRGKAARALLSRSAVRRETTRLGIRLRRILRCVPLDSHFFGGWGRALAPAPLPRWYFLRGRLPAYPFFRKEKIHPHVRRRKGGAESSERVLLRSCFLRNLNAVPRSEDLSPVCAKSQAGFCYAHTLYKERLGGTHGILQPGLPPVGGGGRTPSEAQNTPSVHTDRKIWLSLSRNPDAAQEVPRTQEGAFFFT